MQKRIHNILLFWKWKNESTFFTRLLWSSSSLFFYNSRKCRFSSLTFILYFMLVQILVIHSGKTFANRLDERALMKIVLSKQFFRICQHFFSSFLRLNVCFRNDVLESMSTNTESNEFQQISHDRPCIICGSKSIGTNFGVVTCSPCKGIFYLHIWPRFHIFQI